MLSISKVRYFFRLYYPSFTGCKTIFLQFPSVPPEHPSCVTGLTVEIKEVKSGSFSQYEYSLFYNTILIDTFYSTRDALIVAYYFFHSDFYRGLRVLHD